MSEPGTVALRAPQDGSVQAVAFSPDNKRFASGGNDTRLRMHRIGIGPPPLEDGGNVLFTRADGHVPTVVTVTVTQPVPADVRSRATVGPEASQ